MAVVAPEIFDVAIIGGGVNGCAVARDAVGRGMSVFLCEAGDLARATSSASTKLFHGGLRYLEYYDFALVRHALIERENLLAAMPHIARPLRFVLPYHKGLRPAWLLRLGLLIYDHLDFRLGHHKMLPGTRTLDLRSSPVGAPLKPVFRKGFEYSDGWVDDARLVVLNALDAAERGAEIAVESPAIAARRVGDLWQVTLRDTASGKTREITARALVNAGGPWVGEILKDMLKIDTPDHVRLVRGSHIVVKKMFDHDRAYIFQQGDGRVIFAIPFEGDFTLIGTTDMDHKAGLGHIACTDEEADYLREAASEYFRAPVHAEDIVWRYSGVRPLYDDGASSASEVTRDYVLKRQGAAGEAPLINIFGGKITIHRHLAEDVMHLLKQDFPAMKGDWTKGVALPGGDFPVGTVARQQATLMRAYPFLTERWALRLVRAYGTRAKLVLGEAHSAADLGRDFGATLYEAELRYLVAHEWARHVDDVVWRRSKLGLWLDTAQKQQIAEFLRDLLAATPDPARKPEIQALQQAKPDDGPDARIEPPDRQAG